MFRDHEGLKDNEEEQEKKIKGIRLNTRKEGCSDDEEMREREEKKRKRKQIRISSRREM